MKYISKIFRPLVLTPKNATIKHQTATSKSQKLLTEFGVIRSTCNSGLFAFLPMGMRSLNKLISIVENKLETVDAQKISLSSLVSEKLWMKSGRMQTAGTELMMMKDRHNKYFILAPTHEETITDLIASVSPLSLKSLPLRLYQIGNKYRDEMRPRYGTIRAREFLMKDLYTFDADDEAANTTYEAINNVYEQIFSAIGINFIKVQGHNGAMGGSTSHEYHYPVDIGEDEVLECKVCSNRITQELINTMTNKSCPKCGQHNYNKLHCIEVGHAFQLGTKYSSCFNATRVGSVPLQMGCYGLGLSRILSAAVEVLSSETELRWPALLPPYTICIIGPKKGSKEETTTGPLVEEIYSILTERCRRFENDIIIDDRNSMTIGKRVVEAKRFGLPYIIVVGMKASHDEPEFELIEVKENKSSLFSQEELLGKIEHIAERLNKMMDVNYMEHYCIPSDVLNETMNHIQPDHYDSLTGELKCTCGSYLKPPILLCTKGHSSCTKCRRKYLKCTICKESFTQTRSVILEALADKLQFPCPNPGCETRLALNKLEEHENSCHQRSTPCLMAKVYGGCEWKGKAVDWLSHCIKNHKERVSDLPFISFNDVWSPKHRDPVMRYHLMRIFDRIFNIYQIYDTKSGKMMWTVIATGDTENQINAYYFDLEIFNPNNPMKKISFRQACKNESDTDILEASQNVLIPLEQIMYMLDKDGRLHFNLRVNESKNADVTELAEIKT